MSKYERKRKRSRRENIGFYAALSVCLIAVCMAVYSTYNTVVNPTGDKLTTMPTQAQQVNKPVTGIRETFPEITTEEPTEPPTENEITTLPTIVAEKEPPTTETTTKSSNPALQTMLAADLHLKQPLANAQIIREYSQESVYFKTLNVWKPHLGVDYAGKLGDKVSAMTGGEVTKVTDDKLFGKTVEVSVNNAVCVYSGLGSVAVKQGDRLDPGDEIGTVGSVPFEACDEPHIHIAVKINGTYADPLNFIGNDE